MGRREKVIIAGLKFKSQGKNELEESIEELKNLTEDAGGEVVATLIQERTEPDAAYFLGKGKLDELKDKVERLNIDLVIFNKPLKPAQLRNIEEKLQVRVIDRTRLILDIFARRAKSIEGKVQVELAQLEYIMPRLTGIGKKLSRLGGGIGTRGPGEKKLEIDRRRILERIKKLKNKLRDLENRRSLKRGKRKINKVVFSLAGYTNSGKSTLLANLCKKEVFSKDQLFSTLDPLVRRVYLEEAGEVLVSDTVGFIRDLPHQLVESFKSTLEEIVESHSIIIVVDSTWKDIELQIREVIKVIQEIGAMDKIKIFFFNKVDLLNQSELEHLKRTFHKYERKVIGSAKLGMGLQSLKEEMAEVVKTLMKENEFEVNAGG